MQNYLDAYRKELVQHMEAIDARDFGACIDLLLEAYRGDKQVFVAGNGGSAAAANHFVCDFGKNAVAAPSRRFRVLSLCDNVERITAFGNDVAFEEIFREQMKNLFNPGDLLILISASGSSPNLLAACAYAKEKGAKIITLAGFQGGKIRAYADAGIHMDLDSYERIEDLHMVLLHMFTCYVKEHQERLG